MSGIKGEAEAARRIGVFCKVRRGALFPWATETNFVLPVRCDKHPERGSVFFQAAMG
jgi:hypothetical protein